MLDFVKLVDEVTLPQEMMETVAKLLTDAGYVASEHLAHTPVAQIEAMACAIQGPSSGLLKRAFQTANDVANGKRMRIVAGMNADATLALVGGGPVAPQTTSSFVGMLGPEASASTVVMAMNTGSVQLNLLDRLKAVA